MNPHCTGPVPCIPESLLPLSFYTHVMNFQKLTTSFFTHVFVHAIRLSICMTSLSAASLYRNQRATRICIFAVPTMALHSSSMAVSLHRQRLICTSTHLARRRSSSNRHALLSLVRIRCSAPCSPTAATAYNGTPVAAGINFAVRAPADPHAHGHGPSLRSDPHQVPKWASQLRHSNGVLSARSGINGK